MPLAGAGPQQSMASGAASCSLGAGMGTPQPREQRCPLCSTGMRSADPAPVPRRSALRGKGLRISSDATRPVPEEPTPARGRALLGKLVRKIEERRPR